MVNNTQYLTGGKSPNPLAPPTNLAAKAGNAQVTLTWTDPPNLVAEPSGQTIATWAYTLIVRKEGSQPIGPSDGTVVVQSSVRDQYATSGFVDTGLTNDTLYYYGAFAYNSDKVVSEGAFVSATPQAGTPVSQLAVGTLIKINENGAPVEFVIVQQGLPSSQYDESCNGTWLMRNLLFPGRYEWGTTNDYQTSTINSYLNEDYLNQNLSTSVQNQIKPVKIPYVNGNGKTGSIATGSQGLSCKVFLLSPLEVGYTDEYIGIPQVGSKLSFFLSGGNNSAATNKRIAYLENGSKGIWLLRTPANMGYDTTSAIIGTDGGYSSVIVQGELEYLRQVFILGEESYVDSNLSLIE